MIIKEDKGITRELQEEKHIPAAYRSWAEASAKHDYFTMEELSLIGSDFMDITLDCRKLKEAGFDCRYDIRDVQVVGKVSKGRAMVRGEISLIQAAGKLVTRGRFISGCSRQQSGSEGSCWKLDSIEIEWR